MIEKQPLPLVVDGALNLLGRLVTNRNGVLFGYWHIESLELGIYRNAVIHWWASEAIVAVAIIAVYRRLHYKVGFLNIYINFSLWILHFSEIRKRI